MELNSKSYVAFAISIYFSAKIRIAKIIFKIPKQMLQKSLVEMELLEKEQKRINCVI